MLLCMREVARLFIEVACHNLITKSLTHIGLGAGSVDGGPARRTGGDPHAARQ